MPTVADALALAAQGFKVFPVAAGQKAPPLVRDWPTVATDDPTALRAWWKLWPDANPAIHCVGLLVVDVDTKKGGSVVELELAGLIPNTREHRTPGGGWHMLYRLPAGTAVRNSVSQLGHALDVRSQNGYILGPGSVTAAGRYTADTERIAPASPQLVARAGPGPEQNGRRDGFQGDGAGDPAAARDHAIAYLKHAPVSIKGSGGDQTAYLVACRLRDIGVSYLVACELMCGPEWHDGCGWRLEKLRSKPIRSAYTYAQNEKPGTKSSEAGAALFDAETLLPAPPPGLTRYDTLAAGSAAAQGYLVKGIVQRSAHAVLYGPPGAGKTFVALDLAYHVAAGKPWMGRRVHQGTVLYLAYEGVGGLIARSKALVDKYGAGAPLYIQAADFNLRELGGREALGLLIAQLPEKPALIIIDTLARALRGGDENSAQDVGALNGAVAALIGNTGATVMLVHHTGKAAWKGARGSSALLGAIDTELLVDEGQIRTTKQRDIEMAPPVRFALVVRNVGTDSDGDPITSCTVERGGLPQLTAEDVKLSRSEKSVMTAMVDLTLGGRPVSHAALSKHYATATKTEPINAARAVSRALKTLIEYGKVDKQEEGYALLDSS